MERIAKGSCQRQRLKSVAGVAMSLLCSALWKIMGLQNCTKARVSNSLKVPKGSKLVVVQDFSKYYIQHQDETPKYPKHLLELFLAYK